MLERAERSRSLRPDSFPPPVEGDHLLSLSVRGQATGTITDQQPIGKPGRVGDSDLTDGLQKTAFHQLPTLISISAKLVCSFFLTPPQQI